MDEAIKKILEDHEKRLKAIEAVIEEKHVKKVIKDDFAGLAGGLRFLIHSGFFNTLKSVKEVQDELKNEGYIYTSTSISKMLSVDFVNKQKLITRIKEGNVWKYAIRK